MATRITHPKQQGDRLDWMSTLFERCDNERPMTIALIEPVPQPVCREGDLWEEWDDAVLHQDRRMGVLS